METKKIYWKEALELLTKGKELSIQEIDFRNELVPVQDVVLFNKHEIRVSEDLVYYDDELIDCSDIPEITDEDVKAGKIQWLKIEEFPIDDEIRTWIVSQNIKLNELLPQLLKNFYQTVKSVQKNAAF
jgi:hypothetical protein